VRGFRRSGERSGLTSRAPLAPHTLPKVGDLGVADLDQVLPALKKPQHFGGSAVIPSLVELTLGTLQRFAVRGSVGVPVGPSRKVDVVERLRESPLSLAGLVNRRGGNEGIDEPH
jgi:hypothetical protein